MVSKESMQKIRQDVEGYIGLEIDIKSNVGRNKKVNKKRNNLIKNRKNRKENYFL